MTFHVLELLHRLIFHKHLPKKFIAEIKEYVGLTIKPKLGIGKVIVEYPTVGKAALQFDYLNTDLMMYWTIVSKTAEHLGLAISVVGIYRGELAKKISVEEIFNGNWWISEAG